MAQEWECSECGYIEEGSRPPMHCPECGVSRSHFQRVDMLEDEEGDELNFIDSADDDEEDEEDEDDLDWDDEGDDLFDDDDY